MNFILICHVDLLVIYLIFWRSAPHLRTFAVQPAKAYAAGDTKPHAADTPRLLRARHEKTSKKVHVPPEEKKKGAVLRRDLLKLCTKLPVWKIEAFAFAKVKEQTMCVK